MKVFLLTGFFDENIMVAFLDNHQQIRNWIRVFPHVFLVATPDTTEVTSISTVLHHVRPEVRFIVTEIDTKKTDGSAAAAAWDFVNHPKEYNE